MRILLVYPEYPDTFWSFKHALKFIFKKATDPPLGLLTVAAMLPAGWEKKLVDMNVNKLKDKDLKWADYVFISGMSIQKESAKGIIARCNKLGTKVVAGGPIFTAGYEEFEGVDHFVLNEAEITLSPFLEDLKNGVAKHIYSSDQFANLKETPAPLLELVNMKKYASMNIQYSRGCPYNCDFCDITLLYGHKPRTKDKDQVLTELESIYSRGWRGSVFFVDDNFIGNKGKLKSEILPAIAQWMKQKKHPFTLFTQTSINLSDDEKLMELMIKAGFNLVFVGIETPHEESLTECAKYHNKNRDMIACIKKMQKSGFQVQGGFIVGFDSDPLSIFEKQIAFIQESGIVTAMVGLLNVLKGTKLHHRLEKENRLLKDVTGDNTDCTVNFVSKMNNDILIEGYKKIMSTIYSPSYYYARVRKFLREYKPLNRGAFRFDFTHLAAFFRSTLSLGVFGKERFQYWKLLFWSLFRRPKLFPLAVTFAIYGFHFRKIVEKYV
ncbi:MAG: B12-binding domain-containing radical SAM protein [Candidatus Zixiibacteriota bacterium]